MASKTNDTRAVISTGCELLGGLALAMLTGEGIAIGAVSLLQMLTFRLMRVHLMDKSWFFLAAMTTAWLLRQNSGLGLFTHEKRAQSHRK